jgi:hypothetical protein
VTGAVVAPTLDLVEGLIDGTVFASYDLGVQTTTRTVEDVSIDTAFFAEI